MKIILVLGFLLLMIIGGAVVGIYEAGRYME